ncbi:hypothetical protein E2C01_101858 [Portunus trituberculatus]|uniref:Uncharacterized protein n=1 Tax=Portunus trituberculatus TaxID=210409 RepID=A0A5B7KMX6_PORTR|nr:hypothetical protein [Portunus trituberculatus]
MAGEGGAQGSLCTVCIAWQAYPSPLPPHPSLFSPHSSRYHPTHSGHSSLILLPFLYPRSTLTQGWRSNTPLEH